MASDPSMKLRVDRLENDVESIYELIGDFRADFDEFRMETRGQFADFRSQLAEFGTEFDDFRIETRGQFAGIGRTLAEVLRRLPTS